MWFGRSIIAIRYTYAALAAARRADVETCHARIERLTAALAEAEASVPELEATLPGVEFQPSLALDDDEHAESPEDARPPAS